MNRGVRNPDISNHSVFNMTPGPPQTRASLILRLQNPDDVAAWDEFAAIYGPVVFRMARRQSLQSADADDLVQEVMSAVASSISKWLDRSDRGTFRAWLFRIARNTAIDFLTRRKHRPWATGDEATQTFDHAVAVDREVSSDFDIEYRRELFHWASEQIKGIVSESTWQAFWLTSVENRPIDTVAAKLGMSVGSIYIARSRVMKRLRDLVKQHEEVDHEM